MKNQLKTILLLGVLSVLLMSIGGALGRGYFYFFAFLALAMNFVSYFFSDRIVLTLHGAKEVSSNDLPEVHRIVDELSQRAGLPKPKVYLIDDHQPNAFATGRNPEKGVVAVTRGILNLLTTRELRGVIAHELAHIKNRDILVSTIAAAFATALTYIAQAVSFSSFFGQRSEDSEEGSGGGGILLALVAPIAATLLQLGISRSREYLADETGAKISGDPEALASALAKLENGAQAIHAETAQPATASLFIVNPLSAGESVMNWFSTHPPMKERIRRLREMSL